MAAERSPACRQKSQEAVRKKEGKEGGQEAGKEGRTEGKAGKQGGREGGRDRSREGKEGGALTRGCTRQTSREPWTLPCPPGLLLTLGIEAILGTLTIVQVIPHSSAPRRNKKSSHARQRQSLRDHGTVDAAQQEGVILRGFPWKPEAWNWQGVKQK